MKDSKTDLIDTTPVSTPDTPKKPTLYSALFDLQNTISIIQDLAEETENEDEMNALIALHLPVVSEHKGIIQEKIDKRIGFIEHIDMLAKKMKEDEQSLTKKRKTLDNLKKRLMDYTKMTMETMPEIPFKGTHKEFKIQKSGGKRKITYNLTLEQIENVLTEEEAKFMEPEFKEEKTIFVLKKSDFDNAIRNGADHPFAMLEPAGTHLRIR